MTPYASGDGWTLHLGKCEEVLPNIDIADVVITDPPYSERTHKGARSTDGSDLEIDFDSITEEELRTVLGTIRFRRWLVSFMDYHMVPGLEDNPPPGMRGVRMGIWVKPNGMPQITGDRPAQGWEAIWIAHKTEAGRMRWNGGGYPAVFSCNKENGPHPTMKPLKLVKELVTLFSDEGEMIIDPYCGIGTTLVAARDLGRQTIGIEKKEKYAEIAAKRLSQNLLPFGAAP